MDPPGPIVVPEVVQRVLALDADGEARGGGSGVGGVDHGVWMKTARSTIDSGGRMIVTFRSSSQDGYPENHRGLEGSVGARQGAALLVMRLLMNEA